MNVSEFGAAISVTDASRRGISRLIADAEAGAGIVLERRGRPAAVMMGAARLDSILEMEADVRSAALVLSRAATDNGERTSLDEAITDFGFSREELESELEAEEAVESTSS